LKARPSYCFSTVMLLILLISFSMFGSLTNMELKRLEVARLSLDSLRNLLTYEAASRIEELLYDEKENRLKEFDGIFVINGNSIRIKDGTLEILKGAKDRE